MEITDSISILADLGRHPGDGKWGPRRGGTFLGMFDMCENAYDNGWFGPSGKKQLTPTYSIYHMQVPTKTTKNPYSVFLTTFGSFLAFWLWFHMVNAGIGHPRTN